MGWRWPYRANDRERTPNGREIGRGLRRQPAVLARPNKPMVATAHTQRDEYALSAGRRHIGQPLDARAKGGAKAQ